MTKQEALKLARHIQEVDDQLALFADYEGDQGGPTFAAWLENYMEKRAKRAIALHLKAVRLWEGALKKMR